MILHFTHMLTARAFEGLSFTKRRIIRFLNPPSSQQITSSSGVLGLEIRPSAHFRLRNDEIESETVLLDRRIIEI